MGKLFNYDNSIMQALSKVFDCICINFLWLLCCIPIFTIGASSAAYYYAYNKAIRQKRSYACTEFFRGFKENFKQATKIWLLVLLMYIVTFLDCYILYHLLPVVKYAKVLLIMIMVLVLFLTMWVTWLFPYMSRFAAGTKVVMKNCAILMIANFLWSALLLILFGLTVVGFLFMPGFGLFIVPIIYVVFANLILERIFRKYMSPEDLEKEKEIDMYK